MSSEKSYPKDCFERVNIACFTCLTDISGHPSAIDWNPSLNEQPLLFRRDPHLEKSQSLKLTARETPLKIGHPKTHDGSMRMVYLPICLMGKEKYLVFQLPCFSCYDSFREGTVADSERWKDSEVPI